MNLEWILENYQLIINWILGGGFTLASVATVIRTISQNKLNIQFDELWNSIKSGNKAINDVGNVGKELVSIKEKFENEVDEVSLLLKQFLNSDLVQTDLIPELIKAIKGVEELTKDIDYKNDVISRYSSDIKQLRIDIEKIKNRGE